MSALDFSIDEAEQHREILEERARLLASAQVSANSSEHTLEVLEFTIGSEPYAIEIGFLKEVTRMRELSMLPCTRRSIMGLMNFRGQILPILDIAEVLEVMRPKATPANVTGIASDKKVIVLQLANGFAGIAVDEIVGITEIAISSLQRPELVCSDSRAAALKGIRVDKLALIDVERILEDPRVKVEDTV